MQLLLDVLRIAAHPICVLYFMLDNKRMGLDYGYDVYECRAFNSVLFYPLTKQGGEVAQRTFDTRRRWGRYTAPKEQRKVYRDALIDNGCLGIIVVTDNGHSVSSVNHRI